MSDISALRATLFETLTGLKNKTIDLDRAKAINETAQVIINTAKAEVDFMRASGQTVNSEFIALTSTTEPRSPLALTGTGTKRVSPVPGGSITEPRMR